MQPTILHCLLLALSLATVRCLPEYYSVLGMSRSATMEDLKKAYKTKLIKMHPDRFPDSQKKEMEEKFKQVQEAFDVLGDPFLRGAYDQSGHAGVEQAKKDKQQRDFWEQERKKQQEMWNHQQAADPLGNSQLLHVKLDTLSKFHRRIGVWIVLFYKNDDPDLDTLHKILEKIKTDYADILTIARINCEQEEEICKEFLVYSTSKILVFSSYSGIEGHDLDYSEELISARRGDWTKMLTYITGEAIGLLEDYVFFLSENTYRDFEQKPTAKFILFTSKNITPPIWKVLSKEFKNSASFGVVRSGTSELAKRFRVTKFPHIIAFKEGKNSNPIHFTDDFGKSKIQGFIRNVLRNDESIKEDITIGDENSIGPDFHCGYSDKKYCVMLLTDDKADERVQEVVKMFQEQFSKEPVKLFTVPKSYFGEALFFENEFTVVHPNVLIYKGFTNAGQVFRVKSFESGAIANIVGDVLSELVSLKRLKKKLDVYTRSTDELR
jgi:DnaJ-domain-containing protein 1